MCCLGLVDRWWLEKRRSTVITETWEIVAYNKVPCMIHLSHFFNRASEKESERQSERAEAVLSVKREGILC